MNKKLLGFILLFFFMTFSACREQGEQAVVTEVLNLQDQAEVATADLLTPSLIPETTVEKVSAPAVFVPITVEEFGITTVVPDDWPPIENDPLLKNAWGPGEVRFVAFHSIPGLDSRPAMAQLLGMEIDELLNNPSEGEYWEERIGRFDWALYNLDTPGVGLGQSVAMTIHDGTVYIVSLFVEMTNRDAILKAVLENFAIEGDDFAQEAAGEPQQPPAEGLDSNSNLLGKDWVLELLVDGGGDVYHVLPETELTILFKYDLRAAGSAGCNDYASAFTLDENSIQITAPAKTRKNCEQPQGIMLQETQYLSNLEAVSTFQIEGERLLLINKEGKAVLEFSTR